MSGIEVKIEELKSKINNNEFENVMYNASLDGTRNAVITSFSPDSIDSGSSVSITCEVPPGLEGALPGTLRSLGGTFTSEEGKVFLAEVVIILDPQHYTSFSITANDLPNGEYTITILLGPSGKVGDTYRLTSEFDLTVKPSLASRISRITPNVVNKEQLRNTTFTIAGNGLDNIQTSSGFYLQTLAYKFQFAGILAPTSARVRYSSANIPEAGTYRVLARNSSGNPVFSQANLTIE